MLVRLKVGWKAGTIVDMEVVAARELIACGRANAVKYDDHGKEIHGDSAPANIAKTGDPSSSTSSTTPQKPKTKTKK